MLERFEGPVFVCDGSVCFNKAISSEQVSSPHNNYSDPPKVPRNWTEILIPVFNNKLTNSGKIHLCDKCTAKFLVEFVSNNSKDKLVG